MRDGERCPPGAWVQRLGLITGVEGLGAGRGRDGAGWAWRGVGRRICGLGPPVAPAPSPQDVDFEVAL